MKSQLHEQKNTKLHKKYRFQQTLRKRNFYLSKMYLQQLDFKIDASILALVVNKITA